MTVQRTEKVLGVVTPDNGNINVLIGISETIWHDFREGGAGFLTFDVRGSKIRLALFGADTCQDVLKVLMFAMCQGNSSLIGEAGVIPDSELVLPACEEAEQETEVFVINHSSLKDEMSRMRTGDPDLEKPNTEERFLPYLHRVH